MNRKLILGAVAGVAAIGLAVGGTTYAAYSDFGDIGNNSVAAGTLSLALGSNGQGDAPMDFGHMVPGNSSAGGDTTGRTVWIVSNAGTSTPNANLAVTFKSLVDKAAACATSQGKAQGEALSDINGCGGTSPGGTALTDTGTPAQGNLSRVLTFQLIYYPTITSPSDCATDLITKGSWPADPQWAFASYPGNLYRSASANGGTGTSYTIMQTDGKTPVSLTPGQGACMFIKASWTDEKQDANRASNVNNPTSHGVANPDSPTDNAAQGDSLTFDAHFDLTQDMSAPLPVPNP